MFEYVIFVLIFNCSKLRKQISLFVTEGTQLCVQGRLQTVKARLNKFLISRKKSMTKETFCLSFERLKKIIKKESKQIKQKYQCSALKLSQIKSGDDIPRSVMVYLDVKRRFMYQNRPSKSHQLPFDQRVQIVIPPKSPASVPEHIETPSDGILHRSE